MSLVTARRQLQSQPVRNGKGPFLIRKGSERRVAFVIAVRLPGGRNGVSSTLILLMD